MKGERERRCIITDTHAITFELTDNGFVYTVLHYVKNTKAFGVITWPEDELQNTYELNLQTYLATRLQESWDIPLNRTTLFKHEVSDKFIQSLIDNIQYQINAYSATTEFIEHCDLVGIRDVLKDNIGERG
jgi:hypothetical protein